MATASSVTGRLLSFRCEQCGEDVIVNASLVTEEGFCSEACFRADMVARRLRATGLRLDAMWFDEEETA